ATAWAADACPDGAQELSRPHRLADGDVKERVGLDRAGQDARSVKLFERSARASERRSREPRREPDGARLGGARVRNPGGWGVARRLRGSTVAAVGGRRSGRRGA